MTKHKNIQTKYTYTTIWGDCKREIIQKPSKFNPIIEESEGKTIEI